MKTHWGKLMVIWAGLLLAPGVGAQTYSLGTTNLVEGPSAGADSVVLGATNSWTATANDSWLHLSAGYQSGTVSTNVIFTFDANPGATRTGTLTIAGQTVTITQAGSTYVSVNYSTTIVSTGLNGPGGVAVDGAGNVYIADTTNNAIKKWSATDNTVTTLVSSGLNQPIGVAVDSAGNVYFSDSLNNAIKKWSATDSNVTTLVSSGISSLSGVSVDGACNVYIISYNNVKKWTATNSTVTTLVSSGLTSLYDVAVDVAGNVYITDLYSNPKKWTAANNTITALGTYFNFHPAGVAVDGRGNVYVCDKGSFVGQGNIQKWTATNGAWNTFISSGLSSPAGMAVDGAGNLYLADKNDNTIKEWPRAFVDTTPKVVGSSAGGDTLPATVVLPATAKLTGPFLPTSDSAWLTITGVTNGVVSFAFTANSSANRTANVVVLGKNIAVTQLGPPSYSSLRSTNLVEGPAADTDSVAVVANGSWTATANDTWLHLSAAIQSGMGNTNVIFTFDANSGATRTGTITIAGQTVTIIQAGSTYVPVTNTTTLVSSGLSNPYFVAVDGAGNVYISDYGNNAIKKWTTANNTVTTLVSSGLINPNGVAVDGAGNIYIADFGNLAFKKWTASNSNVTTLVSSGLSGPYGVAVDGAGNAVIADGTSRAVKEWTVANSNFTTVVSGMTMPVGVAVDGMGNVYIADTANRTIKKWTIANGTLSTLVSSGLSGPYGVAVDGAGNVYIAAAGNNAIKKWTVANSNVTTLVTSGLNGPGGVAVDSAGNVYIADKGNNAVKALPHAFIDSTTKVEGAMAGNDALPVVVPATANLTGPFLPISDSPWLTISGVNNAVVSYAFTANYTTNRTANITLLGQKIAVTQPAVLPPVLNNCTIQGDGSLRFGFTNNQGATFTVWTATNMMLPFTNWTQLCTLTNNGSGQYNFTNPPENSSQRFYRVTAP